MKVLISIATMNLGPHAAACLHRVIENCGDAKVVLTINDGSAEGLPIRDNFQVFQETENTGFQHPHNRAFRIAAKEGFDFFFCLNDDCLISAETIPALLKPFERDPKLAVVGDIHGCSELNSDFGGKQGLREYVEFSSAMVRVAIIPSLRANLFNENLTFAYGEDSELSLFLREKGYRLAWVDAKVKHASGSTRQSSPELERKCAEAEAANHAYLRRRFAHYLQFRRMDHSILIRREAALGDVILTTALVRAIKRDYPACPIFVETVFPEVFDRSPNVQRSDKHLPVARDAVVIDLNGAYENRPRTHVIDAYAEVARAQLPGLGEVEHRTELFPSEGDFAWIRQDGIGDKKTAVIHTDGSHWPGKHWALEKLQRISDWMTERGWEVFTIGTKGIMLHGASRINQSAGLGNLAGLFRESQLFIGPDSGPWHVAQAMGCPTVIPFGCTRSRYLSTIGSPHVSVESDMSIPGSGERHTSVGRVDSSADSRAMDSVTVEMMLEGIRKLEIA